MGTTEGARPGDRRHGAAELRGTPDVTGADDAELRDHGGQHGVTGEGFAAVRGAGPAEFGGIEFHRTGAFLVRGRLSAR
nr:hypothetical protein C5F59_29615 [Streptomyces sp. QL37]